MPTLTLSGGNVSLTSSWTYTYDQDGWYTYGTPSTSYDAVTFDLSGIPEGAEIQSATLSASRWGSGKRLMYGKDADSVSITLSDINPPNALRVTFSYQSNGGYKTGTAISGTETASAGWNNITLTITYKMPYSAPTPPTSVSLSDASPAPGQSLTLSWSGAEAGDNVSIAKYEVYRAASASGNYSYLTETTGTSVTVTAPEGVGSYYYKVKAIGSVSGYDSALSSAYAVAAVTFTAPTPPTSVSTSASSARPSQLITLSWSGAQPGQNVNIEKYEVYRATSASGSYSYISSTAGTSISVYAPSSAGSYYYRVKTIGSVSGYNSDLSDSYDSVTVTVTATRAPTSVSVTPDQQFPGGEATLSWSGAAAGTGNAITGYAVYRAASANGAYTRIATLTTTGTGGSLTVTAPEGGAYYYKIITLGAYLNSGYSPYAVLAMDMSTTSDFSLPGQVEAGQTLTITLLSNQDKVHTLTLRMGESEESISFEGGQNTLSYDLPYYWLYAIPDSETGTLTVTLFTEGGGSVTREIILRCPDHVTPTVKDAAYQRIDNTVPADWGILVQGISQASLTLSEAADTAYASPIALYAIQGAGKRVESAALPLILTTDILPAGENIFTISATDQRGRTGTRQLIIPVEAYDSPALSGIVTMRCDENGEEADEGTWGLAEAEMIISSLAGKNTGRTSIHYRTQGAEEWMEAGELQDGRLIFGGGLLSIANNYEIRLTASDTLGKNTLYYDILTRAMPELHIRRKGGAWAFGGIAQKEGALTVYGDVFVTGHLIFDPQYAGMTLQIDEEGVAQFVEGGGSKPDVPEKKAFSLCTWEEVSQICKAGLASEYWALGDTKNLITGDSSTAMRIIGFDHDTVSDPVAYGREKAGITLEMVYGPDALKQAINSLSYTVQWTTCAMRNTTLAGYLASTVPEEVKNVLVPVEKEYMNRSTETILSTSETLFLLSVREVKGSPTSGFGSEGERYAYYAAGNSAKKYDATNVACIWWTRSLYNATHRNWYAINTGASTTYKLMEETNNAFPCMCI